MFDKKKLVREEDGMTLNTLYRDEAIVYQELFNDKQITQSQ